MKRAFAVVCIILDFCLLLVLALEDAAASGFDDYISINCGSISSSKAVNGREWLGDVHPKFSPSVVEIKGSSSLASVSKEQAVSVDPVPYRTARISRSQFSYTFRLNPGQKYIRLHFNPTSYKFSSGFKRLGDFFSVEAGPYTLLTNFSALITSRALSLNTFVKEFCINVESEYLSLVFSPATGTNYAFVNGIEIISAPSSLSYCHDEEIGVQVIGQDSIVYIDSATALEMVHRLNLRDYVPSGAVDDIHGMFRMGAGVVKEKGENVKHTMWNISVDVGFWYLVRLHFCEIGVKMAEAEDKDFIVLINGTIVASNADIFPQKGENGNMWYKNYMVMVNGNKQEGKRNMMVSLHMNNGFVAGHGPFQGYEIFKLSNPDNSLASPNPLPPAVDSLSITIPIWLRIVDLKDAIAVSFVLLICLVNIIVLEISQNWDINNVRLEAYFPSSRDKKHCRHFSLAEIQLATNNFSDGLVIGEGRFGKVYKGHVDGGNQIVAIRRWTANSKYGKHGFLTEIEMLSVLRHVNLISLIGYCFENREMILVYEHMPCGSLADHLYKLSRNKSKKDYSSLSWKQRLNICIGAGRGINYLHTGHRIVHCDIKSSNILLDENFVAKVADFSFAKSLIITNSEDSYGYFAPNHFSTHKKSMKSDVYSFGLVLLEVLCGRPAVKPWAGKVDRSLAIWALDKISKGEADQIVDPNLREEISPASLKAFVKVVERCLHNELKKQPAMVHIIIKLELALQLQMNEKSISSEMRNDPDVLPIGDTGQQKTAKFLVPTSVSTQQENMTSLSRNVINAVDPMSYTDKALLEKAKSLFPTEMALAVDSLLATNGRAFIQGGTRQQPMTSSNVKIVESPSREQFNSQRIYSRGKIGVKSTMRKLSRFWPWDRLQKSTKPYEEKNQIISISESLAHRTGNMLPIYSILSEVKNGGSNMQHLGPTLRKFSLIEVQNATRNFSVDTLLGEGGFGRVYKGSLELNGIKSVVAVKVLNSESWQGLKEWQAEVKFLGNLSHPNLVKLLGYCLEENVQLLVYEYMQKGSLDSCLFQKTKEPLPWNVRMSILTGAARGLAFLHSREKQVIHRDFKASNILLDKAYTAKLADFGLVKYGAAAGHSHVSTQVIGTYGYAAPEYIATGHLYVKSDVYSFGVVLLEVMTGLRVIDRNRPSEQLYLVEWMKPLLSNRKKLNSVIDPRLEGKYPAKHAYQIAQLARSCLENEPKRRPSSKEVVETLERSILDPP